MMGAMTPLRHTGRSILGLLDDFWTDVRLALRTWRRNPGLAFVVTTILTVGIGISSTAVTLIIDEYFPSYSSDPNRDTGTYAQAYLSRTTAEEPATDFRRFNVEDVEAIQRHAKSLRSAAWRPLSGAMGDDMSALVSGRMVTCNFFSVRGVVRPVLGRFLDESDCATAARVAVISESLWRRRFGADPGVIGRVISYNLPLTIVGVSPGGDGLGPAPPSPTRCRRRTGRRCPGCTGLPAGWPLATPGPPPRPS